MHELTGAIDGKRDIRTCHGSILQRAYYASVVSWIREQGAIMLREMFTNRTRSRDRFCRAHIMLQKYIMDVFGLAKMQLTRSIRNLDAQKIV